MEEMKFQPKWFILRGESGNTFCHQYCRTYDEKEFLYADVFLFLEQQKHSYAKVAARISSSKIVELFSLLYSTTTTSLYTTICNNHCARLRHTWRMSNLVLHICCVTHLPLLFSLLNLLYMLLSLRLSSSSSPFTTSPAFSFLITFISNHIKLKITLIDGIITHPLPCSSYVRWRKWVEGEAARLKLHEISMKFFL